ncbi:MAG: glycosyltransferase [Candidatus Rokuibacteriota bacterium]
MSRADRLRILHVLGGLNRGGVETWLLNVMRAIDHRRFETHFVVHTEAAGAYDPEIRALGGRIIPCPRPSSPWRYGPALRRVLRGHGPYDVVHSHVHHFSGYVLGVARSVGVPTRIAHSHTDSSIEEGEAGVARRLYVRTMRRWIHRHATAGFAASRKAAAALYGSGWALDPRWRTLYYGIDLEQFAAEVDGGRVRRALGLPEEALVIGHVGRFVRQKNHGFLLRVAAEVARREPRARLLLVGEGPLRPVMEREVERAGLGARVVFAGGRPDVPAVMRGGMDVFVLPSLWEGLGIVLLEAQAAGLPCVLADTVPEEADVSPGHVRRLSLRAPAGDWAQAVVDAWRSAPRARASGAPARMRGGRFDIRTCVRDLEDAYLRLAASASRGPHPEPATVMRTDAR